MEDIEGTMIKLSISNYSISKSKIEDLLYCKDLYYLIKLGYTKLAGKWEDDWEKMHRKTVGTIWQLVYISVYHHISKRSMHKCYGKIRKYEKKNAQMKAYVIRKLVNLKLRDGWSIAKHLSVFQYMINQLNTMKITLDDELQALLLLSSLSDS